MDAVYKRGGHRRARSRRRTRGAPTTVVADITISLDGFVTARDAGPDAGLGVGREPLDRWVFSGHEVDEGVLGRSFDRSGAVVMGRNTFDVVDGPDGWGDDMGYGRRGAPSRRWSWSRTSRPPRCAAPITSASRSTSTTPSPRPPRWRAPRTWSSWGGRHPMGQALRERLVDELVLHVSPVILGAGTPLFTGGEPLEIEQADAAVSPFATHITHITYRLPR